MIEKIKFFLLFFNSTEHFSVGNNYFVEWEFDKSKQGRVLCFKEIGFFCEEVEVTFFKIRNSEFMFAVYDKNGFRVP